ncbi:aryl-sulfate sulfotransferase [Actinomadura graeca]|uniref:Aryl-sulfate sulfotransferase n=1 Tax=Actinomadura graeca TaxID=2750812 RepID=A0ABX8QUQ2_9ACTN|nr:arylsulfotransferase family protein [Actinomadura graeca]QXJ22368.1 aryl-sulfate sulfotransferase [Actinomadura graeca]
MIPTNQGLAPGEAATRTAAARPAPLPEPPRFEVRRNRPGTAAGVYLTTPQSPHALDAPHGPLILDGDGRPVWFHPVPDGELAADLRVQRYQGRPVLTWWQGTFHDLSHGRGVCHVADERYRIIASVSGSAPADLHEFRLTPRGTALLMQYVPRETDLSAVGGPPSATVLDGVVEEVDVATGETVWRWSSLDHIPVTESDLPYGLLPEPYDYLHLNSVDEDADGDLLVSARYTSAVYKVDRRTGEIVWRLGGRQSSFPLGAGVRFGWQHDATWSAPGVVKVFDNATVDMWPGWESRVAWIRVDAARGETGLVRQFVHPEHLCTTREGAAHELPGGGAVVAWGPTGRMSEFSPDGELLFDAALPPGEWSSYRVYKSPWEGRPEEPPSAFVQDGSVRAVWNGATGVARWRVLAGASAGSLEPVAEAPWDGLDTAVPLPGTARGATHVRVDALDGGGGVVGSSDVVTTEVDGR